jgi:chromatin structure-remodeling complex subunit RSC1/2
VLKKNYNTFSEFVKDVAQICHNAQVYNRPSAPIFEAAVRLRNLFKEKLQEYVKKGTIKPEEAELPDLGEIPEVEDSPPPEVDEEGEGEEDEEDEDEDEDDSDDEGTRRRGKRRGRRSGGKKDLGEDDEDVPLKKRGRPPKVFTPLEARIYALLKGLRKFKNENGELRVLPFEKLPDKALAKDYYAVVKNPIALDGIKRNYKRKKYHSVDQVLADLDLLFENAKLYNEDGSGVYEDAVELQKQAHLLAEQEKAKPDDQFRDEDGKLPLTSIEYKGEVWKVGKWPMFYCTVSLFPCSSNCCAGDWVHINNPNDPTKPIVAQIYRLWQDSAGLRWVNACWYYRPEQTVHHYEKHFYRDEVVKTGQYRDHRIEEIDDRCFVMFITRYPKGRPRGFPEGKSVYVCESRYNEEKFKFNKIKTWASCLPDEVREKDYEMDLYGVPLKMKKQPSPIKHLLQVDLKETDDLPKPTWANPNAPPLIGAVHRRPREPNVSVLISFRPTCSAFCVLLFFSPHDTGLFGVPIPWFLHPCASNAAFVALRSPVGYEKPCWTI